MPPIRRVVRRCVATYGFGVSRPVASHVPLAVAIAIAVGACGSSSSADPSRCGTSSLTGATWSGVAWVGVGVPAVVAIGYYGDWYDPVDDYDPTAVGPGTTIEDPTGSGDETPIDVPPSDDAPSDPGDSADVSGGDDTSTDSLAPLTTAPVANGCFTCTVGCLAAGTSGQPNGRQALGVSDASHDAACRNAVQSLATWSHGTLHQRLSSCEQVDQAPSGRVPAAPSVGH